MKSENIFTKPVGLAFFALLTCALWGSAFPAIKTGFAIMNITTAGGKILYAGYRFTLAGVLSWLMTSMIEKKPATIRKSSIPAICLQGLLQTTIQYICFYIGLSYTTGAKGSVINGSNVFFAILAAHFMMKNEKIDTRKVVGCLIGFAGIIVVNCKGGSLLGDFSFMGEGMVLLCSVAYGISSVTLKMFSDKEKPGTIAAFQLMFGGVLLIVIGKLAGGSIEGFDLKSGLLLLYLSLTTTVSFYIWANLLKYNPVGKVTIFGFSIPVFGTAFSSIFLHENVLTVTNMISIILVSVGIVIVNHEKSEDMQREIKKNDKAAG